MYSTIQSLRARGAGGDPLPEVWKNLSEKDIRFRRGHLTLVAAGPGVGKSSLILSYAIKSGVAALYVSADSDPGIQTPRVISMVTGKSLVETTDMVLSEELGTIDGQIRELPIRFTYDASPTTEDIELTLKAYEELYGCMPEMVIVDNLTNVRTGTQENEDNPFAGLELLCDYLHGMARKTQASIVALHHVKGAHNASSKPVSLEGVKGQIGRVPEMVLTVHKLSDPNGGPSSLRISSVKNRAGKADSSGETFAELDFDEARMNIRDTSHRTPVPTGDPFAN